MEILIYRRQRIDYGEQDGNTFLVLQFTRYVAGPSEKSTPKDLNGTTRNCVPMQGGAVLQRARLAPANMVNGPVVLCGVQLLTHALTPTGFLLNQC